MKDIKKETQLMSGSLSLERVACEYIMKKFSKNDKITIIGFGKSGKLIYKILSKDNEYGVFVSNRTKEKIHNVNVCKVIDFNNLKGIAKSQCLVLSMENNTETEEFMKTLSGFVDKNTFILDISTPPFINITDEYINIREISRISRENKAIRMIEIKNAKMIIDKKINLFEKSLNKNNIVIK